LRCKDGLATEKGGQEMILDEAIERYKSNAEYERTHGNLQGCLEFRQLAEWLCKYQKIQEIVERFKDQYDHTTCMDLMVEIKEVLEDVY